jgi:glycerol-3-phosphate acyltransferase PlsY
VIIGKIVAITVLAYLLGAIPFALIFGWLMGKVDITKHGSGNIGSTNVFRTVGTTAAIVVVILDLGKAVLAVMLAKIIMGNDVLMIADFPLNWQAAQVLAGIIVMVGHNWSVYIKFHGGKGVATYFGSWLAMCPAAALFGGIILIMTASLSRYVSMGSILGSLGVLILMIILTIVNGFPPVYLIYSVIAVIMIVYQHRNNISRLQTRTELRIDDNMKIQKPDSATEPPKAH